jgi:transcriptional regulator with XRE-family HTH domain
MLGAMEKEHFGTVLRRAREDRAIQLAEVARTTRVARTTLEAMEKGDLAFLPAPVYVRGFIRAFARAVGTEETSALSLYARALASRQAAEKARDSLPTTVVPEASRLSMGGGADDESMAPRRGLGLAVFVIILLLIATIGLSLLLRRPPQSGEGLSLLLAPRPAALSPPVAGARESVDARPLSS